MVDSRSSKWRSTARMFVVFGRGSMEGRAPMTFSASSHVVSVCTIVVESWRLLRRLVVDFGGERFVCVLRLFCGCASSNLRRQLRRRTSGILRRGLWRRPIRLRAAAIAAESRLICGGNCSGGRMEWCGGDCGGKCFCGYCGGVLMNVRQQLRRRTHGRLIGCVLRVF